MVTFTLQQEQQRALCDSGRKGKKKKRKQQVTPPLVFQASPGRVPAPGGAHKKKPFHKTSTPKQHLETEAAAATFETRPTRVCRFNECRPRRDQPRQPHHSLGRPKKKNGTLPLRPPGERAHRKREAAKTQQLINPARKKKKKNNA